MGQEPGAARLALQDELRTQRGERTEILRPESRFREAADIWMGKVRQRGADSTADTYDHCRHKQVPPNSASSACTSATSPNSMPSLHAWNVPGALSSTRMARPARSSRTRPTRVDRSARSSAASCNRQCTVPPQPAAAQWNAVIRSPLLDVSAAGESYTLTKVGTA